jgi:hypothetical protein
MLPIVSAPLLPQSPAAFDSRHEAPLTAPRSQPLAARPLAQWNALQAPATETCIELSLSSSDCRAERCPADYANQNQHNHKEWAERPARWRTPIPDASEQNHHYVNQPKYLALWHISFLLFVCFPYSFK